MPDPIDSDSGCPCGTGKAFSECCARFINDGERPETAEQLMRSRYTAYTLGRADYLSATWHPTTRRKNLDAGAPVTWLGLEVLRTEAGGAGDREGFVEFVARYEIDGRAQRLHEVSRFVRRKGKWLYVDGKAGTEES